MCWECPGASSIYVRSSAAVMSYYLSIFFRCFMATRNLSSLVARCSYSCGILGFEILFSWVWSWCVEFPFWPQPLYKLSSNEHVTWLTHQVTPLSDCTFYHIYNADNLIFVVCKYQVRDIRLYLVKSWSSQRFLVELQFRASVICLSCHLSRALWATRYLTHRSLILLDMLEFLSGFPQNLKSTFKDKNCMIQERKT